LLPAAAKLLATSGNTVSCCTHRHNNHRICLALLPHILGLGSIRSNLRANAGGCTTRSTCSCNNKQGPVDGGGIDEYWCTSRHGPTNVLNATTLFCPTLCPACCCVLYRTVLRTVCVVLARRDPNEIGLSCSTVCFASIHPSTSPAAA
jgi:hypothetical protein